MQITILTNYHKKQVIESICTGAIEIGPNQLGAGTRKSWSRHKNRTQCSEMSKQTKDAIYKWIAMYVIYTFAIPSSRYRQPIFLGDSLPLLHPRHAGHRCRGPLAGVLSPGPLLANQRDVAEAQGFR